MPSTPRQPGSGEPERSPQPPHPPLSAADAQELRDLAARLQAGQEPARPKRGRPTSAEASRASRSYWDALSPAERRLKTLAARIAIGRAAERELHELLQQVPQQQDGGEGGAP
jgi:hypothetical protein